MKKELNLTEYQIFLSGSTGFIGNFLLRKLKSLGSEVIETKRNEAATPPAVGKSVRNNRKCIIIHCAAAVPSKYSMAECYEINRSVDSKMYDFAKAVNTRFFIYMSTVGVYGSDPLTRVKTVSESDAKTVSNLYSLSKSEMEDILIKEDFCRILRISSPYEKNNLKSPGLYGRFLNKREAIEVVDPFRLQNYVELNTFFDIVQFALTNNYKIINAVSKKSLTNLELGLKLAGHNSSVIVRLPRE